MKKIKKQNNEMKNKKGQVWVETVTYTLVAFILIGLIIGFAKPKIEEIQDEAIIGQSMKMLGEMDYVIEEVFNSGLGNKRKIEFNLKKGKLEINPYNDDPGTNFIKFVIETRHMYSEPGTTFFEGGFEINTQGVEDDYTVSITKKYDKSYIKLEYLNDVVTKEISSSQTVYKLFIENKINGADEQVINLELQ